MFLFLRLLLAHLIGDFPLQVGFVYSAKIRNSMGKLLHVSIIASIMILLSFPFWKSPYLWLIIFISTVFHYIQDWAKVKFLENRSNPNNFFIFVIDQILHVAILLTIWTTPLHSLAPICTIQCPLMKIYYSNDAIVFLICLLTASYVGTFFIATFKATFLAERFKTQHLDFQEKLYGILERSVMFIFLYTSPDWFPCLILCVIPRIFFANRQIKRLKGNSINAFILDTIIGMIFVLAIYILNRFLLTL